jgi:hypothetical protein
MVSVDEIRPEFEQEVEFCNLSNLVLSCPRIRAHIEGLNKPGLIPLNEGEVDRCNIVSPPTAQSEPNTCEEDPGCFRHMDNAVFVCSSKSRRFEYAKVPMFAHQHVIRESQNYKQLWCHEKNSGEYDLFFMSYGNNLTTFTLYCRIIYSMRTEITYVLFSSGVVLHGPDVIDKLRDFSVDVIENVKKMVGGRICLCGHSMGATLSMAVAYHWFNSDRDFFMERVNVVVFGSINLFEAGTSFSHLPNIRSYLNSEKNMGEISVDPFCVRGDISKQMYTPIKLIMDSAVEEVESIDSFEINDSRAYLHSLKMYIDNILSVCKRSGGKRTKRRKKRKTRRYSIHK